MTRVARPESFRTLFAWCMVVLLLSGCATSRMIDSDVQSYAGSTTAVTPASYRFERLPSQMDSALQNQLETSAELALSSVGLTRTDSAPRYTVQVAVRVEQYNRYPYRANRQLGFMGSDPNMPWNSNPFYSPLITMEPPWYRHVVHVVLRDANSSQIAYESTAEHDGPWSDTLNLLAPMLDAALRDFPAAGSRKVTVELAAPSKAKP